VCEIVSRLELQPPASSLQPLRRAAVLASLALALSACGNIEPWVKPYERQALADPIMSFGANPVSSAYIDLVHDAREGARGATGGGGGGCGCN
jgi:hypothetical protein